MLGPCLATVLAFVVAADDARPPFLKAAFDDFSAEEEFPSVDKVRGLLLPAEGHAGTVSESSKSERRVARFSGVFRYAQPWPAGYGLRAAILDIPSLSIHVWAGERGVSLRFRPEAGRASPQWAIYGTRRQGDAARPEQFALWATDEGRYQRTGEGTFALHWAGGLLAMTRGDVVLWRVPLESQPTEVILDGTATVRGLGLFPSEGPPDAEDPLTLVRRVDKPAELDWQTALPDGVTLERMADGPVELAAAPGAGAAQTFAVVIPPGLHEYVFELENTQPGTGVYLGDASGEPIARVALFRVRGRPGLAFGMAGARIAELERAFPESMAIPYAGTHQWLRVLVGAGIARLWTSGDGRHWSQTPEGSVRLGGACHTVGLYVLGDRNGRAIRLRSLQVRRLDALAALAPAELVEQAAELRTHGNSRRPPSLVERARPADVAEDVWRRAVALRMIVETNNASTGQGLLARLLADALERPIQPDAALRLLAEAARLTESGEGSRGSAMAALYEMVGRDLLARRDPAPFSRLGHALLAAPPGGMLPSASAGTPSPQLLRNQLLRAVYEGRWDDVAECERQVGIWSRRRQWANPPLPAWEHVTEPLIEWAGEQRKAHRRESQAADVALAETPAKPELPLAPASRSRARKSRLRVPVDASHPLLERLDKDAYNAAADLEAALAGRSLREACQIIRDAGNAPGLVPTDDAQLLVSLPVAVERATAEQPELPKVMEEHFGPLAELRVKRAMEATDVPGVEAVAEQFPGSRAAREAQSWLGDRAMAAGQFASALAFYRRGLEPASAERSSTNARLRLAAAMLGQSVGDPAPGAVEFGHTRMEADEFEQMIAGLRRHEAVAQAPAMRLPPVGVAAVEMKPWTQFPPGGEPKWWPGRRPLDLAARQTAFCVVSDKMLASTPARLVAFRLADGQLQWSCAAGVEPNRLQPSPGPADPVVAGDKVFLRRPSARAWELVCVALTHGQLVWTGQLAAAVISDPLVVGPHVLVLVAEASQGGRLAIDWAQLDANSGRLLARWPVLELRDEWQGLPSARAAWTDDTLVATVGGCVIACDGRGRLRWLRRQTFLAPKIDVWHRGQAPRRHDAPRVIEGRVYATQPDVCALECIDLAGGKLLWRRAEPELRGVAGIDAHRVVLETGLGLVALDAPSGRQLWAHEDFDPLKTGVFCDASAVLSAARGRTPEGRPEIVLQWLDAASGAVKSRVPLAIAWEKRSTFGPLVLGPGTLWALAAHGEDDPRQIVRLSAGTAP